MISFGCVDSDAKIFLILSPPLENSTTHNAIIVSVVGHCILKSRWRRSLMKAKEAKQHVSTRCPWVLSQREKMYLLAVTQSFYRIFWFHYRYCGHCFFEKQMKEKFDEFRGSKAACELTVPLSMKSEKKCTCWLLPKVSTVSFWFSSALVVQLGRAPTIDLECCSPPCCLWIWFPVATYVKEIFSAEHKNTVTEFWVIEFVS